MTEESKELQEMKQILHTEAMDLDKMNESMRGDGLPVISTSVDATAGASITSFKEFQLQTITEIATLTPRQIQDKIRQYKFEAWKSTVKAQAAYSHLQQLASTMSREEKAQLKITDIAFNPKELATPQKAFGKGRDANLTNEEKQAKDLMKVLPHLDMSAALELIRKGRNTAFQKGVVVGGAGVPASIDTCPDCNTDYPVGTEHKCPSKSLPEPPAETGMSMLEKIKALRERQK